ncbi:MAG: oxygen-dependent coproporphyrinogen oxidase [Ignavibacteriae bacterium]|nr:oxygen-dependent coproporphyrinogen oxidase [Ignavibacteria bacterium]MBI3363945.1 oxygen-dependent coproporphyrinogen oxidase [Ignavibacteriota bacterium]
MKTRVIKYFAGLQDRICSKLEEIDRSSRFLKEDWSLDGGAGGGATRVIEHGGIFEKAGVNFSAVTTQLSEMLAVRLKVQPQSAFATGISLVLHPESPMIPTVHMNLRYFELANGDAWFGGGADLTPYYLFNEDAHHFHNVLREMCNLHNPLWYPQFKKWCDEYFFLKHRNEARGVGGIFFDYERENPEQFFAFVQDAGNAFLEAYAPIVEKRRNEPWGEREKGWQKIRRGRYVEFNLVYDRGTLFGLETGGRTESILISLPPEARWTYNYEPEAGSREAALLEVLQKPREWA